MRKDQCGSFPWFPLLPSSLATVKVRLSSEVAVMTGIHTSAVLLKRDCTSGSEAMVEDIISSTSSNFADNLSNSFAISSYKEILTQEANPVCEDTKPWKEQP